MDGPGADVMMSVFTFIGTMSSSSFSKGWLGSMQLDQRPTLPIVFVIIEEKFFNNGVVMR